MRTFRDAVVIRGLVAAGTLATVVTLLSAGKKC
jgi:hypothetical protein